MKKNAAHVVCIILVLWGTGCTLSMAQHTIRATGRFASASITSGGNFAGAATSTALGTGVDIVSGATHGHKGKKFVTIINPETGIQQDLLWREGMNIYTARRTLAIKAAPKTYELLRGKKTIAATFDTILKPDDVVRWAKP